MLSRVFGPSSLHLSDKLAAAATSQQPINMEACFSQLTLDIIGKAVFNYDFDALNRDSPLIQAVYTSLKETEQRATDLLPLWKVCGRFVACLVARFLLNAWMIDTACLRLTGHNRPAAAVRA
jgi:carotene epsilon-monooxygenase